MEQKEFITLNLSEGDILVSISSIAFVKAGPANFAVVVMKEKDESLASYVFDTRDGYPFIKTQLENYRKTQ